MALAVGTLKVVGAAPEIPFQIFRDDSSTNSVLPVGAFHRTTSGTAADGIGAKIELLAENSVGNLTTAGAVSGVLTEATTGSGVGQLRFSSGGAVDALTVAHNGNIGIGTTTPGSVLAVVSTTAAFPFLSVGTDLCGAGHTDNGDGTCTATLQPGSGGFDTYIQSVSPTTNFGTNVNLLDGDATASGSMASRDLIKFDVSSIPSSATVQSVTLSLFEYVAADQDSVGSWAVNLQRLRRNWVESEATYNIWSTGNSWTTAGAGDTSNDIYSTVSATVTLDGTAANDFVNWTGATLTSDVQGFVDGSLPNYGWRLVAPTADNHGTLQVHNHYRSSDYGTAADRPKLVVTYAKDLLIVTATGDIGIGTASPAKTLDVKGEFRFTSESAVSSNTMCGPAASANGDLGTCSSSIRYKQNVEDLDLGLDVVRRMRPVSYEWKTSGDRDVGFVAEEVAEVAPILSIEDQEHQTSGIKYRHYTAILTKAIQEQQEQIDELRVQNAALKQVVCRDHPGEDFCNKVVFQTLGATE